MQCETWEIRVKTEEKKAHVTSYNPRTSSLYPPRCAESRDLLLCGLHTGLLEWRGEVTIHLALVDIRIFHFPSALSHTCLVPFVYFFSFSFLSVVLNRFPFWLHWSVTAVTLIDQD